MENSAEYDRLITESTRDIVEDIVLDGLIKITDTYSARSDDTGLLLWATPVHISREFLDGVAAGLEPENAQRLAIEHWGNRIAGHWIVTGDEVLVSQAFRFESAEEQQESIDMLVDCLSGEGESDV